MNRLDAAVRLTAACARRESRKAECFAFKVWQERAAARTTRLKAAWKLLRAKEVMGQRSALRQWRAYSMELEEACRQVLLRETFAQTLFRQQVLAGMQQAKLTEEKFELITRGRYFKKMKEVIDRRRYLVRGQMAMLKYAGDYERYVLQVCFSALRQEKEANKAVLLEDELAHGMNPAIESAHEEIVTRAASMSTKESTTKLRVVHLMMGRRLHSYVRHW